MNDFRNYTLVSCSWPSDEPCVGDPPITDYWAFHTGDDDVPACVAIASNLNGEWNFGATLCDYDELRAVEVHHMDGLLPHEVQREFRTWLETRELLQSELNGARAHLRDVSAPLSRIQIAALSFYAASLKTQLNSMTKEAA